MEVTALAYHPLLSEAKLLVVSPLSRAVQTASLAFAAQLRGGEGGEGGGDGGGGGDGEGGDGGDGGGLGAAGGGE